MNLIERNELLAAIYKEHAHLGSLVSHCERVGAVSLHATITAARDKVQEAINEFQPDEPEFRHKG